MLTGGKERDAVRKPFFIGIAGGTGSGKSTFTNRLKETFGEKISVVYYDNYYRRRDDLSFEERSRINYDHPDAFETDLIIDHLRKLRNGEAVDCPVYDYTIHNRSKETVRIEPSDVIIVEGIMVLQNPEVRELLDIKIYVEADADERILRRVIRDVKERGRDVEGIAKQYLTTVKPMHYIYVEPTKYLADIVLNSGMNDVVFDVIKVKILSHLAKQIY
jgi:uridine kinase